MSSGIVPFGALPQFAGLSPDDLARLARSQQPATPSPVDGLLFDRAGMGGQGGFSGTSGTIMPPAVAAQPEPEADGPAPRAMPAPPARPLNFGSLPAPAAPAEPAPALASPAPTTTGSVAPSPAASSEPAGAGSSFFGRLGDPRVANVLLGISQGLLSTKGFGQGIAAGIGAASKLNKDQAVTDLAQQEFGLKTQKLAKEQQGQNATRTWLKSKGFDDGLADAAMGNPSVLSSVLTQLNKDPTVVQIGGNKYSLKPGEKPTEANLLGPAEDDKTVTPVAEADRVALGLPAGSYQKDANGKISPINPTGTTINMGAEKAQDATVGKAYGDYQVDLATKGRNAGNTLNSLALMEQAARSPNFYSGTGAETVKRANQFLVAMGVKDANYTKPTEVFDALSNKVVLDGLGGSLGPGISNTDRDYIGRTAPTLAQSQAGNLELIAIARSLAQRQQAVSKLARDYAANNGGRLDSGFDQKLEEYAGANPLFPAAQASATQRSDGATGANGPGGIAAPRSQADFDALPKGAMYVDPADGRRYRKN